MDAAFLILYLESESQKLPFHLPKTLKSFALLTHRFIKRIQEKGRSNERYFKRLTNWKYKLVWHPGPYIHLWKWPISNDSWWSLILGLVDDNNNDISSQTTLNDKIKNKIIIIYRVNEKWRFQYLRPTKKSLIALIMSIVFLCSCSY